MALYVHLVKMTREGAGKIRDLAAEYAKVRKYNESLGAKILCTVACFGEYDFVSVTRVSERGRGAESGRLCSLNG